MKNIIISLLILSSVKLFAWHDPHGPGAANAAMGGTGVASKSFWGVFNNQASLAYQKNFGAGFYYENNFNVQQTSFNHLSVVIPALGGSFGINTSYFGYSNYNEKKIGLAYGRKLADRFSLGVQLDYLNTKIAENYGQTSILTFEAGLIVDITDELSLGAHVFNPIQAELLDYNNERIPANMSLGISWQANENFLFNLETETQSAEDFRIKSGIEYDFNDKFFLRGGIANNPNIFSFGLGFKFSGITMDISSTMHQVLGFSPQLSVVYQLDNDE